MACVRELSDNDLSWRQGIGFVTHKPQSFAQPRPIIIYSPRQLKGTMSTTMHCALKQCLAAILLAE